MYVDDPRLQALTRMVVVDQVRWEGTEEHSYSRAQQLAISYLWGETVTGEEVEVTLPSETVLRGAYWFSLQYIVKQSGRPWATLDTSRLKIVVID